jgi:hypothetical protein
MRNILVIGLVCVTVATGCPRSARPDTPLPATPPRTPDLQLTKRGEAFPGDISGVTNLQLVPWAEVPGALTDALEARLRGIAAADNRVREALGARFAYLSAGRTEEAKEASAQQVPKWRLKFFNYVRNAAIEVRMTDGEVVSVALSADSAPPESREEIEMAIRIARQDVRVLRATEGLQGQAILTPGPDGVSNSAGRARVLHVVFLRGEERLPRYFALVDMTHERVLAVGPTW